MHLKFVCVYARHKSNNEWNNRFLCARCVVLTEIVERSRTHTIQIEREIQRQWQLRWRHAISYSSWFRNGLLQFLLLSNQIIMIVFDCVVGLKNRILFLSFHSSSHPFARYISWKANSRLCLLFSFRFFGHIHLQFTHFHCFASVIPMSAHKKRKDVCTYVLVCVSVCVPRISRWTGGFLLQIFCVCFLFQYTSTTLTTTLSDTLRQHLLVL